MKSKKKKESLLNNFSYKNSLEFICTSKKYLFAIIILFFLSSLIGYFLPIFFVNEILDLLKELAFKFDGLGTTDTIFLILGNNVQAGLTSMVFGIVLGFFPLFAAVLNGYLVGFVANLVVPEFGLLTLWRLIPHGIFELPAIFLSMGLGLKLGFELFNKKINTKKNLIESLKVFLLIVIPLLVIAAIIEGLLIIFMS